jgi:myosin heavy subunit
VDGVAGKTEASKYVMHYLITVTNALHSEEGRQEQMLGDFIEKVLLRSNTGKRHR